MELQGDRWHITWRDVKKIAITSLLTSAAAVVSKTFNVNPDHGEHFFNLPNIKTLGYAGAVASTAFVAEFIRRLSTDRVKSAQKTLQKAEEKQIKKIMLR